MRKLPRLCFCLSLLSLAIHSLQASDLLCPTPGDIARMSWEELDSLSLETCHTHQLLLVFGGAELMSQDSVSDVQLRADVCFSLIADEVQRRSKLEGFDSQENAMVFLVEQLKKQQYNLALQRPSDWQKLLHYMEEGRWSYIANRFFDRNVHLYLLSLLPILLGTFWGMRKIRKKRKRSNDHDKPLETSS